MVRMGYRTYHESGNSSVPKFIEIKLETREYSLIKGGPL